MTYFNYEEQFYQAKQNEKRNKRKQFHSILSAYIYIYIYMKHSMGFLGENVGIFFFCVAKEVSKSKSQRAESKLIS